MNLLILDNNGCYEILNLSYKLLIKNIQKCRQGQTRIYVMEADSEAGSSNSSDPSKPPERILADFGDKESAMKDLIKKATPRDFNRILPVALEYMINTAASICLIFC